MLNKSKITEMVQNAVKKHTDPLKKTIRKSSLSVPAEVKKSEYFSIAKYLKGATWGNWSNADFEKSEFVRVNKTLGTLVGATAGFLITPEYSRELIELLRDKSVVRGLGPRVYPMSGNSLTFNRVTGHSTIHWVGEGAYKTPSDTEYGQMKLLLKEAVAVVKVQDNLLEDADVAVDSMITQDMSEQLGLGEDLAFIQGTGGNQPLGVYRDPSVGVTTLGGGNGAVITFDDLMDAMYQIEVGNAKPTAWLMHPRTKNTLRKLKDGNGNYIYNLGDLSKGIMDNVLGIPVAFSNQIPTTLTFGTSGAVCSYAILGNWNEFVIGQKAGAIKMSASNQASDQTTGEDAFLQDQTWFRAVLRVDCGVRQPAAFRVVQGITVS